MSGLFLTPCYSVFSSHVLVVFGYGAKKKMIWPDAGWIIARMKNVLAFWNWTKVKNPTNSTGNGITSPTWAIPNLPISIWVSGSLPYPACGGFSYLRPESKRKGARKTLRGEVLRRNCDHVSLIATRFCLSADRVAFLLINSLFLKIQQVLAGPSVVASGIKSGRATNRLIAEDTEMKDEVQTYKRDGQRLLRYGLPLYAAWLMLGMWLVWRYPWSWMPSIWLPDGWPFPS